MSNVIDVTDATFVAEVMERSKTIPVLVDFWADWCEPCKTLGPILESLADELDGQLVLAKADAEKTQQVAAALRVQSIPAVYLFKDGQPADAFVGALPESDIRAFLAPHLTLDGPAEPDVPLAGGDADDAEAAYREALDKDPKQPAALLGMARILARRGEVDGVKKYANAVPAESAEIRAAQRLLASLDFWALGAGQGGAPEAPEHGEVDEALDGRLIQAAGLARDGETEQALAVLYEAVGENREYREELGRRAMVSLFGFLGEDSDAVRTWQRRLANLLY